MGSKIYFFAACQLRSITTKKMQRMPISLAIRELISLGERSDYFFSTAPLLQSLKQEVNSQTQKNHIQIGGKSRWQHFWTCENSPRLDLDYFFFFIYYSKKKFLTTGRGNSCKYLALLDFDITPI